MLKIHVLATSVEGQPIHVYELENDAPTILIVAGMHGDEPQAVFAGDCIVDLLQTRIAQMMDEHLLVVPRLNADGINHNTRKNGNGIDINRNFPTTGWKSGDSQDAYYGGPSAGSEPETKLILDLIRRYQPRRILAIHSIDGNRYCVNYDGPAQVLAERMAKENGYPIRSDIGHPTPGSLGTWTGHERKIPTITLELPAEKDSEACWQENRDAVMNFIQTEFK